MHPKTAACLTELDKSIALTARLERRLARLSHWCPPVYWQLDPAVLRYVQQLLFALQQEKIQLLLIQKANDKTN